MDAGDRFELPMHLAYETGVVTTLPAINCFKADLFYVCGDRTRLSATLDGVRALRTYTSISLKARVC